MGDKVRACDGLRRAGENSECAAKTPTNVANRGRVVSLSNLVNTIGRDWETLKANREDAYKRPPSGREHAKLAAAAIRSPRGQGWYGFATGALVSGRYQLFPATTSPRV